MIDVSRVNLQNVSLRYTPDDIRTGYLMSWHFTIQREIAKDLLFDIAYVGNRSNKLVILGDVNQARPQNPGEKARSMPAAPTRRSVKWKFRGAQDFPITMHCRPSWKRG